MELFASAGDGEVTVQGQESGQETVLRADPTVAGLRSGLLADPLPPALGTVTLTFDTAITDLWVVLTWGAAA